MKQKLQHDMLVLELYMIDSICSHLPFLFQAEQREKKKKAFSNYT